MVIYGRLLLTSLPNWIWTPFAVADGRSSAPADNPPALYYLCGFSLSQWPQTTTRPARTIFSVSILSSAFCAPFSFNYTIRCWGLNKLNYKLVCRAHARGDFVASIGCALGSTLRSGSACLCARFSSAQINLQTKANEKKGTQFNCHFHGNLRAQFVLREHILCSIERTTIKKNQPLCM